MIDGYILGTGAVSTITGLSLERIRQLDEQLQPKRAANGRRWYRVVDVEAFLRARGRAA